MIFFQIGARATFAIRKNSYRTGTLDGVKTTVLNTTDQPTSGEGTPLTHLAVNWAASIIAFTSFRQRLARAFFTFNQHDTSAGLVSNLSNTVNHGGTCLVTRSPGRPVGQKAWKLARILNTCDILVQVRARSTVPLIGGNNVALLVLVTNAAGD